MNRRNFFKFLGRAIVATGVAVAVGLPKIESRSTEIVRWDRVPWDGMTLEHQSGIITLDEYAKIMGVNPEFLVAMHGKFDGLSS